MPLQWAAAMSVSLCPLVTDSFDRANSTTTLGNTDTGQAWSAIHGTWGINTNNAYIVAAGASPNRSVATVDSCPDGTVTVTFAVWNNFMWLVVRLSDVNNLIALQYDGGAGARLIKIEAGVQSVLLTCSPITIANGSIFAVTMSGNDFECFHNGSSIGTVTSAFNNSAIKHGIGGTGLGSTPRWNNFNYTP